MARRTWFTTDGGLVLSGRRGIPSPSKTSAVVSAALRSTSVRACHPLGVVVEYTRNILWRIPDDTSRSVNASLSSHRFFFYVFLSFRVNSSNALPPLPRQPWNSLNSTEQCRNVSVSVRRVVVTGVFGTFRFDGVLISAPPHPLTSLSSAVRRRCSWFSKTTMPADTVGFRRLHSFFVLDFSFCHYIYVYVLQSFEYFILD